MILFFGPAGSGKSVQAQIMVDEEGWSWISMGQLLRDTPDEEVHEYQQKGILVPLEKTKEILGASLELHQDDKKLLLDGYPRSLEQAQWLLDKCKSIKLPLEVAINFEVNTKELLGRMKLRSRSDDTPESIKERLAIYNRESGQIFDLFSKNNIKVVHVDGVGPVADIHGRVMEVLAECKLE